MKRLSGRERLFVWAGGSVVAAVLIWFAAVEPLMEYDRRAQSRIDRAAERLAEIRSLAAELEVQQNTKTPEAGRTRPEGFTLFAFVEQIAAASGVRENIEYLRPSRRDAGQGRVEELVELRLEGMDLARLAPYLHRLESAPERIRVKRMTIRRTGPAIGVEMLLSTFVEAEG